MLEPPNSNSHPGDGGVVLPGPQTYSETNLFLPDTLMGPSSNLQKFKGLCNFHKFELPEDDDGKGLEYMYKEVTNGKDESHKDDSHQDRTLSLGEGIAKYGVSMGYVGAAPNLVLPGDVQLPEDESHKDDSHEDVQLPEEVELPEDDEFADDGLSCIQTHGDLKFCSCQNVCCVKFYGAADDNGLKHLNFSSELRKMGTSEKREYMFDLIRHQRVNEECCF